MSDKRPRRWNVRPLPRVATPRPAPTLSQRLDTLRCQLDPRQESPEGDAWLFRMAAIACVPILLVYAVAGGVYGHLPMLTPGGFIDMPGACAWLMAVASFALALVAVDWLTVGEVPPSARVPRSVTTTHTIWLAPGKPLRQVHAKTALPPETPSSSSHQRLRNCGLLVAAIAIASALVGRGMLALGMQAFAAPGGLAPRAEWLLYPLQWVWPWLLPLDRDPFVLGSIGIGLGLFALAQLLSWRKVKGAWLPFLLIVPVLVALNHLGSAAYDFAAARGLGGLNDAALVQELARDPGRHNAFTFLSLWVAIGSTSVGSIVGFVLGRSDAMSDD